MKKHLIAFTIIALAIGACTFTLISCNSAKEPEPTRKSIEMPVEHIDKDDDGLRTASLNPVYFRIRVKEPANLDYNQTHTLYYAYIDGMVNAPVGKDLLDGEIYSLQELKYLTAQSVEGFGKVAGKFSISKANGGKIIAKKLENRYIAFFQYDPLKKKAWLVCHYDGVEVFDVGKAVGYSTELITIDWNKRPQGF